MVNPLVSICIPTYNGGRFLRECLDSCVNQTFRDYEIVICDDGSSDATVSIIEEYVSVHGNIRFSKNNRNLGLVENWNTCIKQARGAWIKFVFQDDYITHNCLQGFADQMDASTKLLVSARNFILPENPGVDDIDYYTHKVRTLENTGYYSSVLFTPESISKIAIQNMCMNFIGEPSLILFRKQLVEKLGFFNPHLKQICDLEFALRVAGIYGLKYIPEKLCAFRIHADSTTSTNVKNKYFELHYIEPLLFAWILLYDANYAVFRSHLNLAQKIKLRLYFLVKCYTANRVNIKENRNHHLFMKPQELFKEIYAARNGNILVRLVALLKK